MDDQTQLRFTEEASQDENHRAIVLLEITRSLQHFYRLGARSEYTFKRLRMSENTVVSAGNDEKRRADLTS